MARTTTASPRSWGGLPHNTIMIIALFLLQLTTLASAGVVFTNDEYVVRPNEPFTINWEGNRGPVTITLMNGADVDLQVVMVIASGLSGTKYTWTPPQTLKTDGYELMIEDGVSNDYSPRFQYPAPPDPSTAFTPTPTAQTTFATSQTISTTPTTSSPASSTSTSSSSADAASQTEGLSTGAKIGIAVGASILGLVLLALLGWFIYNKGKRAGSGNQNNPNMAEGGNRGGPAPVGGYYAPSGTGTFDQDTVIGSNASKSPWAGSSAAARATTPFAELGQPEYTPRELWAGGIYQGPLPPPPDATTKGTVNVQERSYSVPLPIQHPGPVGASNMPPMYEYQDEIQQQQQQQQQQRVQDDWHAVISPASRSGTGVTSNFSGPTGGMVGPGGGFDFGTSPVSVTSSPPPMGYSATVTAGGPPSTPPPGLGRYARDASDGSPLYFAARVHDEEYGHGRTGSRGASRGGGY